MDLSVPEEIILDANKEASKHEFYMLGSFEISPDHTMVAYECDVTGMLHTLGRFSSKAETAELHPTPCWTLANTDTAS